ncbi:MAG TPA: SEC-C metal-binding domain-containing protein [bacterium]|nr:SEC-C metal-binding domain-containing protein [bacterium]
MMNKPDASISAFQKGRRALASHEPVAALRSLREAVDGCSATNRTELARRLYWLSIALRRLGKDGLAIKALASAQRLAPRGTARSMYLHVANDYGMPRAACQEHDDYRAFCSIHIRRYLDKTHARRFSSQTEAEAVLKIIADAWVRIQSRTGLGNSSCTEKIRLFRETSIEFPMLRSLEHAASGRIIQADFARGRAVGADDRCPCGSGLPYRQCCGRTRLPYESERG